MHRAITMAAPTELDGQESIYLKEIMEPGFVEAARVLLESVPAENPSRDGLIRTPERFAKAMAFLLQGYDQEVSEVISPDAIFDDEHSEPIVVKDIPIFSLCEHHLLPMYGRVHVAYIPRGGKIVGLSKLARLVEIFSRRLQVQERITRQIADALEKVLDPVGIGVIVECSHLCMFMRGVRALDSMTITSTRRGCFEVDDTIWGDFQTQTFQGPYKAPRSSPIVNNNILEPAPCMETNQVLCFNCSGCKPTFEEVKGALKTEASTNANDYRLYTKCSYNEFDKMAQIIKNSCFGQINDKKGRGFSLLDIGAGTGHLLKNLLSPGIHVVPSRYVAFEPDADARTDLKEMLQLTDCKSLTSKIINDSFDSSVSVKEINGPFDIVLLSHVLYSMTKAQTEEMLKHSLQFVAPGGVLLVFHKCSSGKLDILRKYLTKEHMMFHQEDFSVRMDIANLSPEDVSRMEAYTKCKKSRDNCIYRNICAIAIEPSSCKPIKGDEMKCIIKERKVSYAARLVVPKAICTPNSVVGVQACFRAASEKSFGFDSLCIIGGGHSANCIARDALVVNMSCWKRVEVHPEEMMVRAGGGATCGAITMAAEKHGLFVPLGDRPGVGLGLILAGGINHFMRKCSLAIDNIIRVVYVSPCGELLIAQDEQSLMRFRGAGSNFGAVLEVHLRAYAIPNITNQHVEYTFKNWEPSSDILARYSKYACELPASSQSMDAFLFYKADELLLATSSFHFGSDNIDHHFSHAKLFHDLPCLDSVAHSNATSQLLPSELYERELYMTESFSIQSATLENHAKIHKLRSVKMCLFFRKIQGNVEMELINSMKNAPTKWCYVHILHGGGKVKDIPPHLTSFSSRDWDFAAVLTGRWPDGDDILCHESNEWVKITTEKLLPYSAGIYSTDLGPDDHKWSHLAYEQQNLMSLAELKRSQDPLMILRHSCPLIDHTETQSSRARGVVVIVCGKRHSGKDWLGNIIQSQLEDLMGKHAKSHVSIVSISERMKLSYAKEMGLDGDLLLTSRKYKELHRDGLLNFYERKKYLDPAFDRKCFVEAVQEHSNDGVLILTGLRDGFEYAQLLSGRPVIFVLVKADNDSKMRWGWNGFMTGIDDSQGEEIEHLLQPDFVYMNNTESTVLKASTWVVNKLAPAIVKCSIREVQNVPKKDVVYKDIIGGLLVQPFGLSLVTSLFIAHLEQNMYNASIDAILAPEALGFTFAGPIASHFCLPLLLARKSEPLFGTFHKTSSNGSNMSNLRNKGDENAKDHNFFMMAGTIIPGQRVLVIDDCIATGATLNALARLVTSQGGTVVKLVTLMEMVDPELNGHQIALENDIDVFSLTSFKGL